MSNLDNEQNPVNWLLGQPVHATEIGGERYIPEQTLSEKIDAMLASANKDVPEARKVPKRTAMDVVERSLYKTLGLSDVHQRVFTATRELDDYLNMAINGHQPVVAGGHTDLLPIGHPLSTNPAEVSLRTKALSESEWVSADPRISEEFRPLVASIYLTSPGSVEHNFLVARLESADTKDVPKDVVLAVTAAGNPLGGGNSFLERSARAKLQRRDRLGRFAFVGGGARAFVKDLKGFIHSVMGRFVGTGTDSDTFDVEFIDDPIMGTGIYRMSTKTVAGVKAYIRNIGNLLQTSKPKSADYARGYALDANNLQKIDAPNGWAVDTRPITKGAAHKKQFLSNDGYALRQYDSTANIPSYDEKVKEGAEVKGLGKGGAIDPKYPVYELFTNPSGGYDKEKWDSDANRFIGYYQSWGDIQASAQRADKKAYKNVDSKQERNMWGDAPDGDFPKTFEQVDPADDKNPFSTYRSKNNATGEGGYTVRRFQPEKHDAVKADMERNTSAGAEFQGFTSGSKDIDPDEPIFEITRQPAPWEKNVKPEIIGYAQDWEDVQSMAEASEMSMPRMGENPRREKVRKFKKDSGLDYINEDEVVTPEDFKQGEDGRTYYTPADENAPRARITEDYRGNYVTEVYDNASDQKKLKPSHTRTSRSREEAIQDAAEYLSEENNIKAPSPTERQAKIDQERRGLMMFKPKNQDEAIPDSEVKKPSGEIFPIPDVSNVTGADGKQIDPALLEWYADADGVRIPDANLNESNKNPENRRIRDLENNRVLDGNGREVEFDPQYSPEADPRPDLHPDHEDGFWDANEVSDSEVQRDITDPQLAYEALFDGGFIEVSGEVALEAVTVAMEDRKYIGPDDNAIGRSGLARALSSALQGLPTSQANRLRRAINPAALNKERAQELLDFINSKSGDPLTPDEMKMLHRKYRNMGVDLTNMKMEGTSNYLNNNLGAERGKMPQLSTPEDQADFEAALGRLGIKFEPAVMTPDQLTPVQAEMDMGNVGMIMTSWLDPELRKKYKMDEQVLYVTRDGYVIDGHHRWASALLAQKKSGKPVELKCVVVDLDHEDALRICNEYNDHIGVTRQTLGATSADAKATPKRDVGGEVGRKGILPKDASPPVSAPLPEPPDEPSSGQPLARLPEGSPRPQSPPLPRMGETEFLDAEKPKTEKIPTFITPQAFDVNSPNFGRDFMPTNDNGSNPGLMPTPDQGKEFDAWLKQWEEGDQEVKKRISDRMAKKHGKDFAKRFIELNKLLNTKSVNITELRRMAVEEWASGRNGAAEAKAEIWTTLNRQINRGEIEVSKAELQALFDEYKEDYFKNKWMSLQAIRDRAESGDKNSRAYSLLKNGLDAQNELRKNRREFDKLGRDLSIFSQEEYRRFMEESGVPMYDGDGSEVFEFNTTMYNQVTEKLPDGSEVTKVVEVAQGKDSGAKKAAERATLAALKRYPKWMVDALTEMAKKTPSGKIQIELDYNHHNKGDDGRGFFNLVNGNLHIRLSANNNDHGLLDYEETASHELGHALEAAIPEIRLAEWSLLTGRTRRVTQNGGVPIADYESVIPGQLGGENGILDAFRNAYLTKSYDPPHPLSYTEVFTMTQERMQGGGSFTITNPHIFDAIELGEMTAEEALFGDNDTAMVLGLMIDGRDSDLKLHKEQLRRGAVQERGGFATTKSASPKVGMINETENLSNQESVGRSAKSQEVLSRIADDGEPQITENRDYGTINVFQKGTYVAPNGKEYKLYFRETKVRHADGTYRITGGGVDITDGYDDIGDISFSEVGKVMDIDGKEVWDESSLPNWYSRNLYDVNNPFSTINYVEVVPEARRQGIATALLEFARKHSSAPIHHSWELLEDGKNFAKAVQNSNNTMLEDFPEAPEIGLPDLYAGKSEKSKEVLSRIATQKEFQVEEFPANRAGVKQTRKSLSGTYTTPDGDKYKMNFQEKETFYEKNGNTVSDGGRVDIRTEDDFFVGYIEWSDAFGSDLDENGKQTWDKNWIAQELHDEVSGDSPFSYIKNIVVTDGFRRKGIATAMLEFGRMHSEQPIYHSRVRTDDGKEFSRAVQTSKKGEEDFPEFTKPVDPKDLTGDDITDLITDSPVTKKTVQHKRGRAGIGKLSGHGYRNPDLGGYKPLFDADGDVVYGKLYDRARKLGLSDKQADKLAVKQTTQIRDFIQRKNDKSRMQYLVENAITPPEGAPASVIEQRKRWARTWENNTKIVKEKLSSALATGNVVEPVDKDRLMKIIKGDETFNGRGFLANDFSTGRALLQTDFVAPHSTNENMRDILSVRNEKHSTKVKVVFKESVRDRTKYTVGDALESGSFPQPLNSRDEEAMTMAGLLGNNNGAFISMTGMGAPTSENAQVETETDGDLGLNDVKAIYVSGEDAVAEVRKALGDGYKNIDVIDIDHTEPFPENGKISFLRSPQSGLKYSPRELEQDIPDVKPEDGKRPVSAKVAAVRKRLSTDEKPKVVETEERSYGDKVEHIKARGSYMTPNGDIIDLIFERKKTTNRDGEKSGDGTTITAFDDNYNLIALLEVTMADYTWDKNNKQVFSLDGVDRVSHPEFIDKFVSDTPLAGIAWISVNDDFQRQGIGTALLEFARDNYPDPIYHSDNLSPDGRQYSLAVKKSENVEEDIPDASPAPAGKPIPALVEDEAPNPEATAEAVEKAKTVREKAEQVEPEITKDVSSIAKALGGVLKSLEHRIKTSKSLARKIDKDAEEDYRGDRGEAALSISDAIRYTMVTNTKNYVQTIKEARERFLALGYKLENEKNFWKSDEYKGYTLKLVSPEGYAVEFQVHTDESYEIKEDLHKLYEELRAIPKDQNIPRQRQLKVELKRLADMIPVPEDESLFDIGKLIGDNKGELTRRGKEFERA